MDEKDLVNLSEWVTAEEAVAYLLTFGVSVNIAQLYQRATPTTRRRRVSITSREVFGRMVLLRSDVQKYGQSLSKKRLARSEKQKSESA